MNPYEAVRTAIARVDQQGLLGDRIRPEISYAEDELPVAILQLQGQEPLNTLGGVIGNSYRFQCTIYDRSRERLENLFRELTEVDGLELEDDGARWNLFVESRSDSFIVNNESGEAIHRTSIDLLLYRTH